MAGCHRVGSRRMPTLAVIMTAQIINGCLLPCIAALLFISVNHPALMSGAPQSLPLNGLMVPRFCPRPRPPLLP